MKKRPIIRVSKAVVSSNDGAEEKRSQLLNFVTGCFEPGQKGSDFDGQYQKRQKNITKSAVL